MKSIVNHQLLQLRIKSFGQSRSESPFHERQKMILEKREQYCSNKIGWEEAKDQKQVSHDRKRVLSCALYITFWHDSQIKNVNIDIKQLHNEASTYGRVLKLSTYPKKPLYKCAFIVFESREIAESARANLSAEYNEFYIHKITWARPPVCIESFKFDTGIGEVLRLRPMKQKECNLLGHGFMRKLYGDTYIPSDIIRICVLFYSNWFDLKIVFCDDESGHINLKNHSQIIPVPIEANHTISHITEPIEDEIYTNAVIEEYKKLKSLPREELQEMYKAAAQRQYFSHSHLADNHRLIGGLMKAKFGWYSLDSMNWRKPNFNRLSWGTCSGHKRWSLVHVWLKYKQIKNIYPVKTGSVILDEELYANEDPERWMELPEDQQTMALGKIREIDPNFDCLVIEKSNVMNWAPDSRRPITPLSRGAWQTWPRAKGDDWRETMQVGDMVDARMNPTNYHSRDRESASYIRYIYPNDQETMSGKCVVHFIGWADRYDAIFDVDSPDISKRSVGVPGPNGRVRTDRRRDGWTDYSGSIYGSSYRYQRWYDSIDWSDEFEIGAKPKEAKIYECKKYSRSHKAKKWYPKKKELRRKMGKHAVKSGAKRIENKMKKFKNRHECLAY